METASDRIGDHQRAVDEARDEIQILLKESKKRLRLEKQLNEG